MKISFRFLLATGLIASAGCGSPMMQSVLLDVPLQHEVVEQRIRVPLSVATAAAVDVDFGQGELFLAPGTAPSLLEGLCQYSMPLLSPSLQEEEHDGQVFVELSGKGRSFGSQARAAMTNQWDVQLCRSLPMALDVSVESSTGEIDLGGLQLTDLVLQGDESTLNVGFDRPNPEVMESLRVVIGVGDLEMKRLGNANFRKMSVDGGMGTIELDFSGKWSHPAEVAIESGLCDVRLIIPREIPVRIATAETVECQLEGFQAEGSHWVNAAWKDGNPRRRQELLIQWNAGMGQMDVVER